MAPTWLQYGEGGATRASSVTWINYSFFLGFFFELFPPSGLQWLNLCLAALQIATRQFVHPVLALQMVQRRPFVMSALGFFILSMLGINIFDLIWISKISLSIIYVIKLRQTEVPSPPEPVGQLIADKGVDFEEFEMVAEEEPPQPSSHTGDPGDQEDWGAAWAKELETEMKKKDAAGWRLGYKRQVEKESKATTTKGTMTKADEKKLRHGWLNKFAVVIQAMDDGEWDLVDRYVKKLLVINEFKKNFCKDNT